VAPPALADPLADARTRASVLRVALVGLQQSTDTAVEEYDGAQETLAVAVTARVAAEQDLELARQGQQASTDAQTARVRSLYELGGPVALYGGALQAGSVSDVLRGMYDARRLLGRDARAARQQEARSARLAVAARTAEAAAQAQVRETVRVDQLVATVRDLLAQQRELVAGADAEVVRVAQAQQVAADRQAELAFTAQLAAAARAAPSGSGPVTGPDVPASQRATVVLAAATAQVGKPYLWGATGPDAFDCSGLTRWAYAAAGIALPRTARQQWTAGVHPALADLQPGDLLFWGNDPADPATIHHVAIYAGGGRMVVAAHSGTLVQVQQVYAAGYVGATRIG